MEDSFVGSPVKPLYDKLMKRSKYMKKFSKFFKGKKAIANLFLKLGIIEDKTDDSPNIGHILAHTVPPKHYDVVMIFNTKYVNKISTELLANSILHEHLHAYLHVTMLSLCQGQPKIIGDLDRLFRASDYRGIADYYHRFGPKFSHELYEPHYEKDFVDILYDFFDGKLPRNKCEALFWLGLHDTQAYQQLPKDKRDRIIRDQKEYVDQIAQVE